MFRIEPRVQGVTAELLELYEHISPSTIGHLTDFGFLNGLQPLFRPIRLLGNAVTVRIPHIDASAIRHAFELAQPGDIIVVDMSGDDQRACWGEFVTYAALDKKIAGAIISGSVTDVRPITQLRFPLYSKGISALTTRSLQLEGEVNTPVSVSGVSIQPGDLIVGDDDGVFVINPLHARELGLIAQEKQHKEQQRRKELGYDKLFAAQADHPAATNNQGGNN
ncbi:Regulator of RNase E activity RraA [Paenibacillus algorifonticola]|uniref:Putative 4-hydroxy-4-methyl-2-oxoglutarate aldolase n=1 Tax=Paenibacillus algorifonticola TaxID=684063 RepID=A0A1I2B768_9BACL|nr:RraA family protein [Paenibacillus algorifonticola]SFE51926.1 Regulator of RNase E activity RraA [Paenibacillus algorifonticola]